MKRMTQPEMDYTMFFASENCMIQHHTECIKYLMAKQKQEQVELKVSEGLPSAGTSIPSEAEQEHEHEHEDNSIEVRNLSKALKEMARKVELILGAKSESTENCTANGEHRLINLLRRCFDLSLEAVLMEPPVSPRLTESTLAMFKPEDFPIKRYTRETSERSRPNLHGLVGEVPDGADH